tara:strand:- start:89 stop:712 length:624 start_codon:yes stop_codon:yes gene_type:complete
MLENKVYIFDNLLSPITQDYIENIVCNKLSYYPSNNNPDPNDPHQKQYFNLSDKLYDPPQMVHSLIDTHYNIDSPWNTLPFSMSIPLQSYFNFKFSYTLLRSKVNIKHLQHSHLQKLFGSPHVDFEPPLPNLWVLLYYVNDSDGDTIIFNETYDSLPYHQNFSIQESITPKKGRSIFFPANIYHSANFPTVNINRIVINNVMQINPL